ncbi:MAG: hypothetical protein WAM78_15455, partial [Candidatus Sulfotelmatobacter sp.]
MERREGALRPGVRRCPFEEVARFALTGAITLLAFAGAGWGMPAAQATLVQNSSATVQVASPMKQGSAPQNSQTTPQNPPPP